MHVKVRINYENAKLPFLLTVTGCNYRADFTEELLNMDTAWTTARKVSENERDHLHWFAYFDSCFP